MEKFNEDKRSEDTNRFLRLLMKHEKRVYAFILSMVSNSNDADDIMQEVTTVMWKKFPNYKETMNFSSWAMTIAKYQVLSFYKKNKNRKVKFSSNLLELLEQDYCNAEPVDERTELLEVCLKELKTLDKDIIRLRYEDNLTLKSIGAKISKSTRATHYALARIHKLLMNCVRRKMAGQNEL
ncbi:sigma-70 family RNA polymerase sigma factor [Sedimentisphaera salicampi]|uniref:RNA polymerase sigma factor n=1 Tax=Sedimentisphaera salicampi TaxID=1941349 RepID=A0A1W6LL40_9BACT|nr:sigma-70 family RNA polymerase sigma factor [Sedimentisphaera salicampi]ARN56510.1 RNA polymerase sigma factor [Sedimentisphaera salicampi]